MQRLVPTLRQDQVAPELVTIIRTILAASKEIAFRVGQGALAGVLGSTLDENIQGEIQKNLDIVANQLLKDLLLAEPEVCAIASEEEPSPVAGNPRGKYLVAFDPLDGSSNIDSNGQIGTIFSILPARADLAADNPLQFCQPGRNQLAAGYVLYGPSTLLVMTTGGPTRCYTLDTTHGSYLLTQPELSIPASTQEFSVNLANQRFWNPAFNAYVQDLLLGETGPRAKRFNMRWNAAMVGDVHRLLTRGGVFAYPSDSRNPLQPAKLRLLYEGNPMAWLVEQAGGKARSEEQRLLDIEPRELHERVAVILGSSEEVDTCIEYLARR